MAKENLHRKVRKLKDLYQEAENEKNDEDPLILMIKLREKLNSAINGDRDVLMYYQSNCEARVDLGMASLTCELIALLIAMMSICAAIATKKAGILLCLVLDIAVCVLIYYFYTKDREKYRRMGFILNFIERELNEKKNSSVLD